MVPHNIIGIISGIMKKIDVSIIIINYKTYDLTLNCIKSIYNNTHDISIEIILIDNASGDGVIAEINRSCPAVTAIQCDQNVGFGQANNIGIKISNGKYILFLNSDTLLLNNAIKIFYDYMESDKKSNGSIGVIGTCLINEENKTIISYDNFLNIKNLFIDEFRFLWKPFIQKKETVLKEKSVDFIVGADLFIRKKILDEIGGFDPQFFMYYEEADLQYRVRKAGYDIKIIHGPKIMHFEGKSFTVPNQRRILSDESKFKFLRKYNSKAIVLIYKIFYIFMRAIKIIKKGHTFSENVQYIKKLTVF